MSSLFKGKEKTETEVNDPWAVMPDWLKDQLEEESGFRGEMLGDSKAIADELAANPQQIAQMTPEELEALGITKEAMTSQGELGDLAKGALTGSEVPDDYGEYDNTYTGDRMSDIIEGRDFNNEYTDSVVDTTLAGMDRNELREALARESQNAATGGTSNSRTAVGQAVASQLHGMNRAETEAKLRSDAMQFGVDSDMKAAGLMDASDQFKSGQDLEVDRLRGQSDEYLMNRDMDLSSAYDQLASSGQMRDMAGAEWLKGFGGEERGLEQAQLDADRNSKAEAMSWLSSIFSGAQGTQATQGGGKTTKTSEGPSMFSQIMGGVSSVAGVAGMMSDENAKKDIVSMEHGLDALRDVVPSVYEYRDNVQTLKTGRTAGLIAQDLEHIPGAVEVGADGYRRVDSYPVLATVIQAVKDLDRRTAGL